MKLFLLAFFSFFLAAFGAQTNAAGTDPSKQLTIVAQDGTRHHFKVELALTPQQQAHGLMNRTEMAQDAGMLFFFGDEQIRSFWMKNTLIPLDMVFIRRDGSVVNIHDSATPNDLTSVSSTAPAAAVLELNGGVAKKLGITQGAKVHHLLFGNALQRK